LYCPTVTFFVQHVGVYCNPDIHLPDNTHTHIYIYLGIVLTADRKHGNELSRRLGPAKADFINLQRVLKHLSLHRREKLCTSKLWLNHDICTVCAPLYCQSRNVEWMVLKTDVWDPFSVLGLLGCIHNVFTHFSHPEFQRERCYKKVTTNLHPHSL
jgi:hypothetical protein